MLYKNCKNDHEKKQLIYNLYINQQMSFQDIATKLDTYANKIRRDAKKFQIPIRDKSIAQKNALQNGKHKHPTKGKKRPENIKQKIGKSVMLRWEELPAKDKKQRKEHAKKIWESLSEDEKQYRLSAANKAVRQTSKTGSKLEHFLLNRLTHDGYRPEFHKEQVLANTKLQIDLYLPTMSIAIEVDGPSHFAPVWGEDSLSRNEKYDKKKSGLIIGKGMSLIRIKQTHDFSKTRAEVVYQAVKGIIDNKASFDKSKIIEIED